MSKARQKLTLSIDMARTLLKLPDSELGLACRVIFKTHIFGIEYDPADLPLDVDIAITSIASDLRRMSSQYQNGCKNALKIEAQANNRTTLPILGQPNDSQSKPNGSQTHSNNIPNLNNLIKQLYNNIYNKPTNGCARTGACEDLQTGAIPDQVILDPETEFYKELILQKAAPLKPINATLYKLLCTLIPTIASKPKLQVFKKTLAPVEVLKSYLKFFAGTPAQAAEQIEKAFYYVAERQAAGAVTNDFAYSVATLYRVANNLDFSGSSNTDTKTANTISTNFEKGTIKHEYTKKELDALFDNIADTM